MAKYLLLKHYRGAPTPVDDVTMDQWTPEEISAHVQYLADSAARLEGPGARSARSVVQPLVRRAADRSRGDVCRADAGAEKEPTQPPPAGRIPIVRAASVLAVSAAVRPPVQQ